MLSVIGVVVVVVVGFASCSTGFVAGFVASAGCCVAAGSVGAVDGAAGVTAAATAVAASGTEAGAGVWAGVSTIAADEVSTLVVVTSSSGWDAAAVVADVTLRGVLVVISSSLLFTFVSVTPPPPPMLVIVFLGVACAEPVVGLRGVTDGLAPVTLRGVALVERDELPPVAVEAAGAAAVDGEEVGTEETGRVGTAAGVVSVRGVGSPVAAAGAGVGVESAAGVDTATGAGSDSVVEAAAGVVASPAVVGVVSSAVDGALGAGAGIVCVSDLASAFASTAAAGADVASGAAAVAGSPIVRLTCDAFFAG